MGSSVTHNWLPVPGYEGRYTVSDHGEVYSTVSDRYLKPHESGKSGHLAVSLYDGHNKRWHVCVSRLVALAFVPGDQSLDACHLDGNPKNNHVSNIYWGTESQNTLDSVGHGTHNMARKTHCPSNHPYDEANTGIITNANGYRERYCRECRAAYKRRTRAVKKKAMA